MRISWRGAVLFLIVSFTWGNMGYADECDDIYEQAIVLWKEGNNARSEGDYARARDLFSDSRDYFISASQMTDCRCPKIEGSAKNNAQRAEQIILDCERRLEASVSYEDEHLISERYNDAKDKYMEGESFVKDENWDEAIAAFEKAASSWEEIAASSQGINGKKAVVSARQARSAAARARTFK